MSIPITEILQKTSGETENIMITDETFRKKSDDLPLWGNKLIFVMYGINMFVKIVIKQ